MCQVTTKTTTTTTQAEKLTNEYNVLPTEKHNQ